MADIINEPVTMGATVEILSSSATETPKDPRMVSVKIAYPKTFTGDKYLVDGATYDVAPETADIFVKAKIATIV